MIFAIWIFLWIFGATGALMLLIPGLALFVRGSYLERPVRVSVGVLVVGFLVFLVHLLGYPVEIALVRGIASVLCLLLVNHLAASVGSRPLRLHYFPYHAAHYCHAAFRSLRLTRERLADLEYARRIRLSEPMAFGQRLREWWSATVGMVFAAATEFVCLVTDISDVVAARGELPHPSEWQERGSVQNVFFLGDLLMICLILITVRINETALVPHVLLNVASLVPGR